MSSEGEQDIVWPEGTYLGYDLDLARGTNLGPATYDEVIEYLSDPTERLLIVTIDQREAIVGHRDGDTVIRAIGHGEYFCEHEADVDNRRDVLILYKGGERPMINGVLYEDPVLAFYLTPDRPFRAERFTGGVRLHTELGWVIDVVSWHEILHITPSGDVAPGFGPFNVVRFERTDEEPESEGA